MVWWSIYSSVCLQGDSDIIFADLDHDGDGKINFDDFSFGFRDFLTPGSRRGSLQLGLLPSYPDSSEDLLEHPKIKTMEVSLSCLQVGEGMGGLTKKIQVVVVVVVMVLVVVVEVVVVVVFMVV